MRTKAEITGLLLLILASYVDRGLVYRRHTFRFRDNVVGWDSGDVGGLRGL